MSCQMNETKAILQKFQAQSLYPTFGSPSRSLPFVSQMFFGCISDQGESTWPSNLRRGAWIFQLVSRLEKTKNDTPWSVQLFGVLKGLTRNSRQRVQLPFGPFGRFISIQCIDLAWQALPLLPGYIIRARETPFWGLVTQGDCQWSAEADESAVDLLNWTSWVCTLEIKLAQSFLFVVPCCRQSRVE